MYDIKEILRSAVQQNCTDVFIISGSQVSFKINGKILPQSEGIVMPADSEAMIREIYDLANRPIERLLRDGDDDFALALPRESRFRVSTYKQRGSLAAVIRVITFGIPDYRTLRIPDQVISSAQRSAGLILVTGPAGSGKSTTLACMIDRINETRNGHIITLEDPIEYLHRNKNCVISQREVSLDTQGYVNALRACLRQAPDVILVGEMRDFETIQTVMTAAETGHLVISTLHTIGAADTIDRVVDVFPPAQQQQIRIQLSMLLQSVISQQLIPTVDGKLVPAFEIMHTSTAIRTMIREAKSHQLDTAISSGASEGMISMDSSLYSLYNEGIIDKDVALYNASNPDMLSKRINGLR